MPKFGQFSLAFTHPLGKVKSSLWLGFRRYAHLHLMVISYILVFSTITLLRHYSLSSSAWDLGIFDQAFYTTVKHGKLFYYTCELYGNPAGTLFGVHFSPILFSLIPFYIILPRPETLLVTQTIILASGAYPTFLLSNYIFKNQKMSLLFSLIYLAYPHLHSVNWFGFHPEAFFVPFTLFSLYFFIKGEWKFYFTFMLLGFFTKEFMPIIFLFFAFGELFLLKDHIITFLRERKMVSKKCLVVIITIIIAVCYYLIAKQIIRLFNPSPPSGFIEGTPWGILGANLLDPSSLLHVTGLNFLGAIRYDFQSKLFYLVTILAPLAFLPVFKLSRFLPVVFWLFLVFLSNYPPYYGLGWQYSALIVPFSIVAAIEGFNSFASAFKLEKDKFYKVTKKLLLVSMLSTLALTFLIFPISSIEFSLISEHDRKVNDVLNWIRQSSPEASILTQYDIFPHVSNKMNSYVIPPFFPAFKKDYYFQYVKSLFKTGIDYVIMDLTPDIRTHAHRVTHLAALRIIEEEGNYGLYASVDGVLVYKLGYDGNLTKYEPFTIYNKYDAGITYDTTLFSYTLPPGVYNATYRMKVSPKVYGKAFIIEIRQGDNVLASMNVSGAEFTKADKYEIFSLTAKIPSSSKEVEFLITNVSIAINVHIDWMRVSIFKYL